MHSNIRCPFIKIEIFSDNTGSGLSPPTNMYPGTISAPELAFSVFSNIQHLENVYNFYIKVTGTENQIYWADVAGNPLFQLNVICGPASTTVVQGAFPSSFTAVQYIDKNLGGSFKLPIFTSTNIGCPLVNLFSSTVSSSITNPGLNFVRDPTAIGGGYYEVQPHDDTVDGRYDFFVYVVAKGGYEITTTQMTLILGCTTDLTIT